MERSREIICKITSASQRVVAAANNHARRKDYNSVSRYHFQLEQDMRRISVACECLANLLEKPLPEGPTVDVRIKDWVCTAEPQECLDILGRMENLLQQDTSSWIPWIFQRGRGSTAMRDKIKEAVDLFDSCKGCFHFLFSTEIWNNEMGMHDAARSELRDHITQVKSEIVEPRCCALVQAELNTLAEHVARDGGANVSGIEETVINPDIHARAQKGHRTRSDQQRKEEEKKLEDILKWLDGLNCAEKQDVTLTFRQEDTCKWLFETTEYKAWRDGESGFLWLRGKSGAGKSVLVSFVIDSFRKDGRQREGEMLTFFYCDFRNERSTSSAEVMRSILSQLLRQLRGHSADPGSVFDDLIKAREWGGGTIGNAKELAGFASRTVTLLGHKPVVIVDALDECRDVRKLIQALMVIKDHVQLFVASRPLNAIADEFSDLPFISMDDMAEKLSRDIRLHITRELDARQRLRDLVPEFKAEIRSVLCKKADGMFRWVQCSIDTLDRCMTRKEARAVLYGLPKGLDETYERILCAIDIETPAGQLAQRALIWLVAALRPLRLCEIMEALSTNLETRTLDRDIAPMHNGALLDACGSLITYSRETGVMNLAHSSVKEYLTAELTRAKLPTYHISEERAHSLLARSCLCYISICLKRAQGPMSVDISSSSSIGMASQPKIQLHPKSHPLLDYALDDALDHFGYLGSMFKLALDDVTMLAEDIQRHSWVWDHVCTPGRWDVYDVGTKLRWPAARHDLLLYILVAFASNSFVRAFFRGTAPKPKKGTNPLVYTAYFNKDEHARTLLRLGVGLNQRGWETIGFRQSLPIEVAFRNRHYTMVTLFVEEGSTVPPNVFRDSFFHLHAQPPPSSIARLLLQTDDFAENINKCLKETALSALTSNQLLVLKEVTEQDLMEIIKRFAQVTDEGFAPNSIKEAFFRFSVAQGYLTAARYLLTLGATLPSNLLVKLRNYPERWKTATMIRFLLDNGTDVLGYTNSRDSALHAILWAPDSHRYYSNSDDDNEDGILEAIKLLVDLGCDPMQVDSHGNDPLRSAVERGYVSVARYLLTLGALIPSDLLVTLNCDQPRWVTASMIRFAVENGADALAHTFAGDSLLHIVLQSSNDDERALEVVKVLIDYGCDPFRPDSCRKVPIHIAVERGLVSVARHLLTIGACLPPDLLAPLSHFELRWSTAPMIQFLVENHVNVLTCNSGGDTLLHIVLKNYYVGGEVLDGVVKLLVRHGCNPLEANSSGKTPLHIAAEEGHISVAKYLLRVAFRPLPPDIVTLHHEVHIGPRMIRLLVENGVNVLAHSRNWADPVLHTAVRSFYNDDEALDAMRLLVGYGCDPIVTNGRGDTLLHAAVRAGHISVARYLLILGIRFPPDLLITSNRDWSRGVATCLPFLIENGVNVLARTIDGESVLHIVLRSLSFRYGNALEAVKVLVDHGCDPFEVDAYGNTPFHVAVQRGNISAARYLVSLGAPVSPDLLVTLKYPVSWAGDYASMIHFLVENGVNVHAHTGDGDSMLHFVLRSSYDDHETLEVVKVLVDIYGCDPFEVDAYGNTPFHLAVQHGNISAVRYFVSLGVPVSPDLLVTLKRPVFWLRVSVPMIHFLVKNGVNVHAHNGDGDSLLHTVLRFPYGENETLEVVRVLVDIYNCNPLESNYRGHAPLHVAIERGAISAARYLLTLGASLPSDLLVTLNHGRWSTVPMIRFLVENGIKVHVRAIDGSSVLHIALQCWNSDDDILDTVKLLISHGCNPLETNYYGCSPLHVAIEQGNVPAARYLLSIGAPLPSDLLVTLNHVKSLWSTASMIQLLAENGIDLLAHANDGDSVLHIALQCSNDDDDVLDTAKLLVFRGCDPLEASYHGHTPLYIAVEQGNVPAARYLLTLGASLSSDLLVTLDRNRSRWSTATMIRLLVENGVNVLAHASDGDSVLHIALRCSNDDGDVLATVKLLVGYGCNSSEVNDHGHTPLHIAVEQGKVSAARYLLSIGAPLPSDLLVTLNRDRSWWTSAAMMHFLVENRANVLEHANNGDSVLHIALQCWNGEDDALEAVKILVTHGCDPLEADNHGHSPTHIAIAEGQVSAARYLASLGASLPPDLLLTLTCDRPCWSTAPMIHFLVENGVNLLGHASDGDSVFHIALRCFNDDRDVLEVAKLLVSRGCEPLEANSRGETPLHIAAARSYVSAAGYLIAQGANVLTKASNGDTVLHFATDTVQPWPFDEDEDGRALRAVKFFVRCGSEPTVPNDAGKTPLHLAVDLGRIKTVKYLLSLNTPLPDDILFTAIQSGKNSVYHRYIVEALVASGSDAQKPNAEGDTPLQVAIKNGRTDIMEYLLSMVQNPPLEDLLSAVALAPPSVQGEMRRMLSERRTRSESPELPPAKRVRSS